MFEASQDEYCSDIAIDIKAKLKSLYMIDSPTGSDSDDSGQSKAKPPNSPLAKFGGDEFFTKSDEKVKEQRDCQECVRL